MISSFDIHHCFSALLLQFRPQLWLQGEARDIAPQFEARAATAELKFHYTDCVSHCLHCTRWMLFRFSWSPLSCFRLVSLYDSHVYVYRDLRGDGDRGNPPRNSRKSRGMEANVAGFPWGWKQMSRDSREHGTKCGIPVGM